MIDIILKMCLLCMHIDVCVAVLTCMCTHGSQVDLGCLTLLLAIVIFETGTLTEPGGLCFSLVHDT